ncbi:PepSY-associated TM helix domain-containing protein [Lysobacter sp. KIS68-7]|uniref:PepSY-associated TM helix domain-containing protein n=1 Tax=Lysobacter sp. KIS68-7 TaxID=2904252 RepID=UPI001E3D5CDE|nr:PepSY-associated TM helix domain-containing protein [Lysobacter sp. KIS68-7]UHQ19677.1 PepSY-associated TM helix domain-containing protein [Lysobacter sp. KIS68-7]
MQATVATTPRRSAATYRWIRQIHLWIGAWGALAAVIYGFTGLVMNHRFGDSAWFQGDSEDRAKVALEIPAQAQASPEALSLWLRDTQKLDAQVIRKNPQTSKWSLSGGSATDAWSLDYTPGSASAEVKHTRHDTLAAFNRLHKGVGGGIGWKILSDSFAICMLLLGLSGIWMWARGRSAKDLVVSVLGVSLTAMLVVLLPALL